MFEWLDTPAPIPLSFLVLAATPIAAAMPFWVSWRHLRGQPVSAPGVAWCVWIALSFDDIADGLLDGGLVTWDATLSAAAVLIWLWVLCAPDQKIALYGVFARNRIAKAEG